MNPDDRDAVVVQHDAAETAAQLAQFDARDGRVWLELVEQWHAVRPVPPATGAGRPDPGAGRRWIVTVFPIHVAAGQPDGDRAVPQ